ncbi:MAG: nitroreductase family protein [Nitrospirae bacterium]|nr:nitroreductase family protein [Nitrospirota bacterium]
MDIIDIIRTRRSVRKFTEEAVSDEVVDAILEAGRWAPSGQNNQPWRFAVVRDREIITEISKLTHYGRIVLGAQVLIPVFLDTARIYHREKDIQGVGACLQNMLLEIHCLGLGGVWLGEIIKSNIQMKSVLGLADDLELMAVIALGWPAENPRITKRRSLDELTVYRD